MKNQYEMHIIINTHWDREYRWSFAETRFRLVEAVDNLIDIMNTDERFAHFHTDSQVSMLDDYLEVKPERAEELKKLVADKRILTGPWYTLPAEFLVSGEALVRNLLTGHRISEELGGVMKAAYNIFSWGQVSQLPQIYKQFGMDTILFYRGIDQSALDSLEFKWQSPDGSEALGLTFGSYHRLNFWRYVYLPYIQGELGVSGDNHSLSRENLGEKGFLFSLCDNCSNDLNHLVIDQPCAEDLTAALKGMDTLVKTAADKSSVKDLLFLQGFDQENPDPIISDLIDRINEKIDYGKSKVGNLPDYIQKVRSTLITEGLLDRLPLKKGEMLDVEKVGDAFGPLYNGVFSARMPLKLLNSTCQRLIECWAEPSAVWSMMNRGIYPRIPLGIAWKELLKNQQHDGIGGCHVDRVTRTMNERYENVRDIGETITRNSLKALTCKIDFSHLENREIGLAVFNSTQFQRSEVVELTVDIPKNWNFRYISSHSRRDFGLSAYDKAGNEVECQILHFEDDTLFGYLKFGNVIEFDATRCRIALSVEDLPPMGYSTYKIVPEKAIKRPVESICSGVNTLENQYLKVVINSSGTLDVFNKETGMLIQGLHYFEDTGDKGGPLKFDPPYEEGTLNTLSESPSISLIHKGPLYGRFRIEYRWMLPERMETEIKIHVPHGSEWVDQGRLKRSESLKAVKIVTDIILTKNSRKVDFITSIDNSVNDHRLRVIIPTGLTDSRFSIADSPFDVVERSVIVPDSTGWYENAAVTWPTESFVAVNNGTSAAAVYHKGLSEYEVSDNASRSICLTLIRAFSTAGNPTETYQYQDLAQCPGKHTFHYSLEIGAGGGMSPSSLKKKSLCSNIPLRIAQTTKHKGQWGPAKSFITLTSEDFIVTALKKAEYEEAFLIRGFNVSDRKIDVTIKIDGSIERAARVSMEEKIIAGIDVIDRDTIRVSVGSSEIASFMLYPEEGVLF